MLATTEAACDFYGKQKSARVARGHSIESAYFDWSRRGEIEETKRPERERVLRHVLDNRQKKVNGKKARLRLLSNPGLMWTFERRVEQEIGEYKCFFVGIERNWSALEWSLRMMPGRKKQSLSIQSQAGDMTGFVSAKAALLHTEIQSFPLRILRADDEKNRTFYGPAGLPHRETVVKTLATFNACWIDIWSPLGHPRISMMLRMLPPMFRGRVPFAFTFQYGRDAIPPSGSGDELEQRAEMIRAELEFTGGEFRVTDHWWYFGPNDSRLATVCGVYQSQVRQEPREADKP